MDWIIETAVSNAAVAAVMALAVWLVSFAVRRPALVHALWVLVLLKLVTPPLVRVPIAWISAVRPEVAMLSELPPTDTIPAAAPREQPGPTAREPRSAVPAQATTAGVSWKAIVFFVWIAGSLLWFTLCVVRTVRFRRVLARTSSAETDVEAEARALAVRFGIRRCPDVRMTSESLSPLLWSLGRSRLIVLPSALWSRLGSDARRTLFAHELAHLARGDHRVRWLEVFTTGLWWWHPAVWLARLELRAAEEAACDAWVVWALPDAARAYANALVETIELLSSEKHALPSIGLGMSSARNLSRRLTMIVHGGVSRRISVLAWIGIAAAALAVLPFVPAIARPKDGMEYEDTKAKNEPKKAAEKPASAEKTQKIVPMSPEQRGKAVSIAAGEIELEEFLRFLAGYSGFSVSFESEEAGLLKKKIPIVAKIDDVTPDVAIALLKANHFYVHRVTTQDNDTFYRVGSEKEKSSTVLPKSSDFKGKRVEIAAGEIEAAEFLRFLADYTGLPVIPASGAAFKRKILIAAPLHDVTAEIVEALLAANGFSVKQKTLDDGKEYLSVEPQPAAEKAAVEQRLDEVEQKLEAVLRELRTIKGSDSDAKGKSKEARYKGRTLSEWVRDMEDRDFETCTTAVNVLNLMGKEGIPHVLKALTTDREELQGEVFRAWRQPGIFSEALPSVLAALSSGEPKLRARIAKGLGIFLSSAANTFPLSDEGRVGIVKALTVATKDADESVRAEASTALKDLEKHKARKSK